MHPADILFSDSNAPRSLSPVEHYAGNERFINKALNKQAQLNGVIDITLDLEDGASVGHESAQAKLFGEILASERNRFGRIGVRVHDPEHEHFQQDVKHVLQSPPTGWCPNSPLWLKPNTPSAPSVPYTSSRIFLSPPSIC